ncbi:protein of unknown function [Methylocella tundrae]|uniref:Uncharacterized protein n=1 Tax=Methylocella tundrae TaxID=227605 RepID=A0A4U8Z2K9_METTU|nr:protein of unknown function [Methylocella tundrae]
MFRRQPRKGLSFALVRSAGSTVSRVSDAAFAGSRFKRALWCKAKAAGGGSVRRMTLDAITTRFRSKSQIRLYQ